MRVSTSAMNRIALALVVPTLLLSACGGEPEAYENSTSPQTSTLQVNQQDEARRNLEEASKPYSLGGSGDESMGRAAMPERDQPLDDEIDAPVTENRT